MGNLRVFPHRVGGTDGASGTWSNRMRGNSHTISSIAPTVLVTCLAALLCACASKPIQTSASGIDLTARNSVARSRILNSGCATRRGFRGADGYRFSDACQVAQTIFGRSSRLRQASASPLLGNRFRFFRFRWALKVLSSPQDILKEHGKRIEIAGKSATSALNTILTVEVYDKISHLEPVSATVRNAATATVSLDTMDIDAHRFNASSSEPHRGAQSIVVVPWCKAFVGPGGAGNCGKSKTRKIGWAPSSK